MQLTWYFRAGSVFGCIITVVVFVLLVVSSKKTPEPVGIAFSSSPLEKQIQSLVENGTYLSVSFVYIDGKLWSSDVLFQLDKNTKVSDHGKSPSEILSVPLRVLREVKGLPVETILPTTESPSEKG